MSLRVCLAVLVFVLVPVLGPAAPLVAPAQAQSPPELAAVRQEISALRVQIEALQKDVDTIRNLLQMLAAGQPAGAGAAEPAVAAGPHTIRIAGRPAVGSASAPVILVEFTDYECSYCAQHTAQTWPELERNYVKTGKVRYVYKNFPIEQIHPNAFKAAVAAACAGDQGRFPAMHARLFAHQSQLAPADLVAHARAIGLDVTAFETCLAGTSHNASIREDAAEAVRGGVRGTPVFVLAVPGSDPDVIVPVRVLVGAQPFTAFQQALDALLAPQQKEKEE